MTVLMKIWAGLRLSDTGKVPADPRDGGNQPWEGQDGRQKHGDFHAKGADVHDDDHI